MPFVKGQSGNPKGKGKGVISKKTVQWETFKDTMLNGGLARFEQELNKLTGKDYCETILKMMEFLKPKMARMEMTGDGGGPLTVNISFKPLPSDGTKP